MTSIKLCAIILASLSTISGHASGPAEPKSQDTEDSQKKMETLRVGVYRSFTGSFGPGAKLQALFEKSCGCALEWVPSEDAGSLFTDFVSGKMGKPDVIVGFDQALTKRFEATEKLEEYKAKGKYRPPALIYTSTFQPIDYSYFAIMVDRSKVTRDPKSLASFLMDSQFKKSLAAQDPRTSSPGYGLLVWLRTISTDDKMFEEKLKQLGQQAISFAKGWSQSYGFLMNGEAKSVFSYLTSELYHRLFERKDQYIALAFPEGHLLQVEYAALVKSGRNKELAKSFLDFLHSKEAQVVIATENWMFPASHDAYEALPPRFRDIEKEVKAIKVDESLFEPAARRKLIDAWKKTLQ